MIDLPEHETLITDDYATPHVKLTYPHIRLLDASDALALIIPSLPDGDLPLVMTYRGQTRLLKNITKSAIYIEHLCRLSRLEFVRSPDDVTMVTTGQEILELGVI